jgi:putative SOS response-associated peptidase YedK
MCGRYTIKDPVALAAQIAHLTGEPIAIVAARYNIAPSQLNPVVRPRKTPKPAATLMRWGLVPAHPHQAKSPMMHANARSEDMFARPAFKEAVQERRCVVPADGFYEWRVAEDNRRLPHHFCLKSRAPFFMAGLYAESRDDAPATYALLTTGPNAVMTPIHDRMPVILTEPALERWLTPGPISLDEGNALCRPLPAEMMEEWPVSLRVNSAKNDDATCVVPTEEPPPDQGLLF